MTQQWPDKAKLASVCPSVAPVSFGLSGRPFGSGGGFDPVAQGDVAIHALIQPKAGISDTTKVEVSLSPEPFRWLSSIATGRRYWRS